MNTGSNGLTVQVKNTGTEEMEYADDVPVGYETTHGFRDDGIYDVWIGENPGFGHQRALGFFYIYR